MYVLGIQIARRWRPLTFDLSATSRPTLAALECTDHSFTLLFIYWERDTVLIVGVEGGSWVLTDSPQIGKNPTTLKRDASHDTYRWET